LLSLLELIMASGAPLKCIAGQLVMLEHQMELLNKFVQKLYIKNDVAAAFNDHTMKNLYSTQPALIISGLDNDIASSAGFPTATSWNSRRAAF